MTAKGFILSALAMVLAWDLLKPSRSEKRRHRRLRLRAFIVNVDGQWQSFPSYRSYRRYLEREGRSSSGVHPDPEPTGTKPEVLHAFIQGRNAAIDNAAIVAYDMGHPEIRDAINRLVDRDAES